MGSKAVTSLKVSCIQMAAGENWKSNLDRSLRFAGKALAAKPDVIVLPENFLWRGASERLKEAACHGSVVGLSLFQTFAKCYRTPILLGSLVMPSPVKQRYFNMSILLSKTGSIEASYQKIHLFDVNLPKIKIRESRHFIPGKQVSDGNVKGVRCGLSVCYDLRFPELYRKLAERGCRVVFVPANFTHPTGQAHWEVLLRARAIENQMFVVACGQVGVHPSSGIRSYGNSMIIDPWGRVLARMDDHEEGILTVKLDLKSQLKLRKQFPVLTHRRLQ
ncbi:MAG: carbon-nitrogen hydrolase family protein [Candidatus Omnitrophica bacterium]|nr:carbon-nitrogen hydrolase family protein [Candidatus Omnitrophota bacterium]